MKWVLALLVPGGLIALAVYELAQRRRATRDGYVSDDWLRQTRQQESRIEFVGVAWTWPIDKQAA